MTVPTKITNHVAGALDDILSQFDESPRLRELVSILATQVQLSEDVEYEVLTERELVNAVGVQLDITGKIVGGIARTRGSLNDADYLKVISAAIRINNSNARAEDTTEIVALLVDVAVRYTQYQPAHYELTWEIAVASTDEWLRAIQDQMPRISALGVSWSTIEGPTDSFRFDIAGRGFDEGKLARRTDVI